MRSRSGAPLTVSLLVALMAAGCAMPLAPRGYLKGPEDLRSDVYGGWMDLKYRSAGKAEARVTGELIAVGSDSIFIANDTLRSIALAEIASAQLMAYDCDPTAMGGLVVFGTVTTVANGFFLIFTAPVWMIGGGVAAVQHSREPVVRYPKREWSDFSRFARYPQGLPPGIDRSRIRMKSLHK